MINILNQITKILIKKTKKTPKTKQNKTPKKNPRLTVYIY